MTTSSTKFKKTDAGMIPEDWDVRTIGETLQFINGKAHEPHVSKFGDFVVVNSRFISTEGAVRKYSTVNLMPGRQGDVLMVMSDLPNGRALAKCFLVDENNKYAVNQRVCIFRSKAHDSRYLRYILNRNSYFMAFDDGVQQTHLLNDAIRKCPLVLSSRIEQESIANALSDTDALIAALERLIIKKQAVKQGMMQQLLTGKTRLPGFTEPWCEGTLGDIADVTMGQSPVGSSYNRDGVGAPLINGPTEFTNNYPVAEQWTTAPVRFCKPNSVLICVRGSSTGRMNIADTVYCIGRGVAAIESRGTNDQTYLRYALAAVVEGLLQLQSGSTFPSIDSRVIRGARLDIPAPDEQLSIGRALHDTDDLIAGLVSRLGKSKAIKHGMMQELLTGRTRLPLGGSGG